MDKKILWFKDPEKGWVPVELHATDAVHALNVDPENWSTEKPSLISDAEMVAEPVPETELHGEAPAEPIEPVEENEHPGVIL